MEVLRKDVAVKMKCLEAQYETTIQKEAIYLYTLIQRKAKNVEDMHKEKISLLQKSYRNQLADAIYIIKGEFKKYHLGKGNSTPDDQILKELLTKLEEKNLEVLNLTEQLEEYKEMLATVSNDEVAEDTEKDRLTDENGRLKDENEKLKDDIDSLHIIMDHLRDDIKDREDNIEALANNLKLLTIKAEEERKSLQKMTLENRQLNAQLNYEREAGKKKVKQLKEEMEKEIESIEKLRIKEALAAEEKIEKHQQERKELEMSQDVQVSQRPVAAQPTVVEDTRGSKKVDTHKLQNLKDIVAEQKAEIERLKKELRITIRTWEKKFDILRKSFHAVKDEMFLRNNLQRQAAALHYAAVSYALDVPGKNLGDSSGKQHVFTAGTPLPNISAGTQRTDCTSGRSSCMSSRATDTLSCIDHEFQPQLEDVDDEDLCGDLPPPLPPPPHRQNPAFTES